ncbi:TPA: ash family protein [Escherichia coli]|uniref:Ash family protein n=1 Tax=Escherichia coli O141:H4 TaxID=2861806 RepID=A0ABD7FBK1_ECOLX|nr:ash family protein [Escherichia coli]QYE37538.1 ash family protein [Escherichia coli O141:H4]EEW8460773.1 ash family protein [Escherichia coli]EFG8170102.1 ash family protein [Escherichia coli]EFH8987216.1 ash family protein [Escherichia coli]
MFSGAIFLTQPQNRLSGLASRITSQRIAAFAFFFCVKHCHIRIMVGRAGAEKSAPGFVMTGYANPVRLTTSLIGVRGGDHPINWSHHI